MRSYLACALSGALMLAALPAAACTGSVASGITLAEPSEFFVRNAGSCAVMAATLTFSPSNLATAASGAAGGGYLLTPQANGSGTLTISAPGFAPIQVPLTVSLGALDIDSQ